MKKLLLLLLSLSAIHAQTVSTAFAEGVGFGNSTDSESDQTVKEILSQYEEFAQAQAGMDSYQKWVPKVTVTLMTTLEKVRNLIIQDNLVAAQQQLHATLKALQKSLKFDKSGNTGSLIRRLVNRGLVLSTALNEELPKNTVDDLNTKIYFLTEYFKFIIQVQTRLDFPNSYPSVPSDHPDHQLNPGQQQNHNFMQYEYGQASPGCNCIAQFDYGKFQAKFLEFAGNQLKLLKRRFATTVTIPYGNGTIEQVRPMGDEGAFLRLAMLVAEFTAFDVGTTIFKSISAETVGKLLSIHSTLKAYKLNGDLSMISDDVAGLQWTYAQLDQVISALEKWNTGKIVIFPFGHLGHPQAHDLISWTLSIPEGTTRSVAIPSHQGFTYLKAVKFNAWAIREEATLVVKVNGEFFGRFIIPPRDPLYFVEINREATSIELSNEGGGTIQIDWMRSFQR